MIAFRSKPWGSLGLLLFSFLVLPNSSQALFPSLESILEKDKFGMLDSNNCRRQLFRKSKDTVLRIPFDDSTVAARSNT